MNIFEKAYKAIEEAKKRYFEETNEVAREVERTNVTYLVNNMGFSDETESRIWGYYKASRDVGNEYLDINGFLWKKDVEPLVECLKKNEVEYFTLSIDGTGSLDIAGLFQENGCTAEKLVQINTQYTIPMTDEYEKRYALLFKVNKE